MKGGQSTEHTHTHIYIYIHIYSLSITLFHLLIYLSIHDKVYRSARGCGVTNGLRG